MEDNRYADLHVHSTASDGAYTPSQVVRYAAEQGFSAIAITDHDAVSGIDEAVEEARKTGLELIPGVELSTEYNDKEIHILGYLLDWHDEALNKLIQEFRDFRVKRMERMLSILRNLGCHLEEEQLMRKSEEGAIGRVHLAKAMVASGFVENTNQAFDKYLALGRPAYMKKAKLSPQEACDLIKRTRGVPVLAHPNLMKNDQWIPRIIDAGIEGIETYYPGMYPEESERYCRIARKRNLLITGGSDCHQSGSKFLMGSVKLPYRYVEILKEFAQTRLRR
jgi:predicted metal-dependent phosphoesterase TrpH